MMKMKGNKFKEAFDKVYNRLSSLSNAEFIERLEKHKDGDIAKIILDTEALNVGEIESNTYGHFIFEDNNLELLISNKNIVKLENLLEGNFSLISGKSIAKTYSINVQAFNISTYFIKMDDFMNKGLDAIRSYSPSIKGIDAKTYTTNNTAELKWAA